MIDLLRTISNDWQIVTNLYNSKPPFTQSRR